MSHNTTDLIERECCSCGADLEIVVYDDGTYEGGHYFDEIALGDKEYWECERCYRRADR